MRIDKSSWHYRVWKASFGDKTPYANTDLCHYFWRVVLFMLGVTVMGCAAVAAVGAMVYYGFVKTWVGWGIVTVVAVVVPTVLGLQYLDSRRKRRKLGRPVKIVKPKAPKEPGLIRQFMKAHKEKVCPLIEFTN